VSVTPGARHEPEARDPDLQHGIGVAAQTRPSGSQAPDGEEAERRQAVERIKRKRHFHRELVVTAVGVAILMGIWASSEYHNAGGWPTQGFSQSSGIHDVWNY